MSQFEGYTSAWGAIGGGGTNTFNHNVFTGNGSTTAFALAAATESENNLLVFIDGVFQEQGAYSIATSGGTTILTMSAAPASGRKLVVYQVSAGVSGSNLNIDTMTGDGSDTTLTLSIAPVNENNTQVFFDGVYQNKSTYSISGTTLTFSTAPPTGVAVEVMTFTQTEVNVPVNDTIDTVHIKAGAVTTAKIESSLDLSSKTLTLPAVAVPSASTATTQAASDNTTKLATTAYVTTAIANLIDGAPGTLNTLNELAAALADDAAFSSSVTTSLAAKANIAAPNFTGNVTFDTTTLTVDATNNRVGIGTASPASILHVTSGADTVFTLGTSNATADGRINFRNSSGTDAGRIWYNTSGNRMMFYTNSAEHMRIGSDGAVTLKPTGITTGLRLQGRSADNNFYIQFKSNDGNTTYSAIGTDASSTALLYQSDTHKFQNTASNSTYMQIDSSGNVLIGKTNTTFSNHGMELRGSNGGARFIRSNAEPLLLNRTGSVGITLGIYNDGVEQGNIGSQFDDLNINGSGDQAGIRFQASSLMPRKNQADSDATISLGLTSHRFTDLHLSNLARIDGTNQYYVGMKIRNNYSSVQSDWNIAAAGGTSGWGNANGNFVVRDDTTNSTAFEAERGAGGAFGAIYVNSNGKVGIGTSSPASWSQLHVAAAAGGDQTGADQALYVQAPTATNGHGVGIRLSAASGSREAVGILTMVNNASGNSGSMGFNVYNGGATIPEVMRLTNDGNLGIGRIPVARLDVQNNSSGAYTALRIRNSGQVAGSSVKQVFSLNRDGSDVDYEAASIQVAKNQNWTTAPSTIDGYMKFNVVTNESVLERMRIDGGGTADSVIIWNNAAVNSTGQAFRVMGYDQDSKFALGNGGNNSIMLTMTNSAASTVFSVNGHNGTVYHAGTISSDRDLKENIENVPDGALARIKALKPRTFNFKEETTRVTDQRTGFIAQEVKEAMPDGNIVGGTDGEKDMGVDYNGIIAQLVKAVQELEAEVAALKGE